MLDKQERVSILIVDNNIEELELLHRGLEVHGFEVVSVSDSEVAIQKLEATNFDVVLIDLMMPVINGLELLRIVKNMSLTSMTLLMSSYHLSPLQLSKANTGVAGFVPKPFDVKDLVVFINDKLFSGSQSITSSDSLIPQIGKNYESVIPLSSTKKENGTA